MEISNLRIIHDEIFNYLELKGVYFKPRIKNNENKLAKGYWFLGTDKYVCINFWNGYDHDRKVPNIHLQIYPDDLSFARLVMTSRSDQTKLDIFKAISLEIEIEEAISINEFQKIYLNDSNDIDGILRIIDDFINKDKVVIDRIIDSKRHEKLNRLKIGDFETWKDRIYHYKKKFNKSSIDREFNKPTIAKTRPGRSFVDDSEYFYKQLEKIKRVNRNHKKAQNRVKGILETLDEVYEIRLEENNIDLVLEYADSILIMELKTDKSPKKCIRQGIGQIIEYYHKNFRNWSKPVVLCISGPNQLSKQDLSYLKFLKNILSLDLQYYSYEFNQFYN